MGPQPRAPGSGDSKPSQPPPLGEADTLAVVCDHLTAAHSVSRPPAPQSRSQQPHRPEDSEPLPYSVSRILNIKQVGEAVPVSTVGGCYDVRYLMLGYSLVHIPYGYFNIIGSNKEYQRQTCSEGAFLTFENVHKCRIHEGTAGSSWESESHASVLGTETVP